jgi:hypothetical protein
MCPKNIRNGKSAVGFGAERSLHRASATLSKKTDPEPHCHQSSLIKPSLNEFSIRPRPKLDNNLELSLPFVSRRERHVVL